MGTCTKKAERFIGRLDNGNYVSFKGKAGKSDAETLGFRILTRRIDGVIIRIRILSLYVMKFFTLQSLGERSLSGFASAHQK